ncbi:MAG: S8 family serine peptidase, partial [Candidatus Methanomethylicaceae archaeon]
MNWLKTGLAIIMGVFLVLSQITPVVASSALQRPLPPPPPPLDETIETGKFHNLNGWVGVMVELKSDPAVLTYAESKAQGRSINQIVSATRAQINKIQQEQATFTQGLQKQSISVRELYRMQRSYNGIALYVKAEDLSKLSKLPGVKAVHPLTIHEIDHTTSVPLIGALQVWAGSAQYQGQGIKVGVIDTGIDYIHTNFGGPGDYTGQDFTSISEPGNLFPTAKVVGGWDFAGDNYNAADPNASTPSPDPDPMDCNGHGTHVAGTIAGFGVLPNGSTYQETPGDTYADLASLSPADYRAKFRIGPGVAPKAQLYALRVFGCSGSTALTPLAIEWAVDPDGDGDFSDHLDVINMSLGSSFGTEYDASAVASNNAALAGVIVVASAGNSGDVYYITGAPGVAQRAISVASSQNPGAVLAAFDVTNSSDSSLIGTYMAGTAAFGPQTYNVTGEVVVAQPYRACSALTNASAIAGKIALIERGDCAFVTKVQNAQDAGAIGVLIVNNAPGFPPAMGGTSNTITIPAMSARDVDGALIKNVLDNNGTVEVNLNSSNTFSIVDPSLQDVVSSFTSRGVARGGMYLKPDVTAPGQSIFSAKIGSGNAGISMSGTSMAAPHVAGVMAILRQQHPDWSVEELKALVMNTATDDVWASSTPPLTPNTPSRVGAGRVSVQRATESDVIAYNATAPELVSVSFGVVKVTGTQTLEREIIVKNKGNADATYNVAFISRYQSNPGISFAILDSANNPVSTITVPAGSTVNLKVQVNLDSANLNWTRDPNLAVPTGRFWMTEAGGVVELTSTSGAPTLRVPVHIMPRAASQMSVQETSLVIPAAGTGTISLTPVGTSVDLSNDWSQVSILEWVYTSDQIPASNLVAPTAASADLQYIGVMSNPAATTPRVFFGISTYGDWDTLYGTVFEIYIDVNEDGVDDFVVYNYDSSSTRNDIFVTRVFNISTGTAAINSYVNIYTGHNLNTNAFNNRVIVLPVTWSALGLGTSNPDFNFRILSWNREADYVDSTPVLRYHIFNRAFDTNHPAYGAIMWDDDPAYSPTFDITYNTAYITTSTLGLLLLHHHNATSVAEVIPLNNPTVASI